MNDVPESSADRPPAPPRASTAGGLLRQARQAQGLHIAALAAAIKVVPRKLELLESDQFDQLPDATFTRALAQTVCRTLKIDATPILALLPPIDGNRLEQVSEGLNMPFRERPGRLVPREWASVANPVLWVTGLIVALTIAVYAAPAHWLQFASSGTIAQPRAVGTGPAPAASVATPIAVAVPAASPQASAAAEVADSAPAAASGPAPADATAAAMPDAVTEAAASGVLQFHVSAQSWVDVTDARGQSLIARVVEPGENVGLDGVMPMKVKIGNAKATQVVFRGQPLELATHTRDNVARLELK